MTTKKFAALVLAVIMVLAVVPFAALAQAEITTKLDPTTFGVKKEQLAETMGTKRNTKVLPLVNNNAEIYSENFDGDDFTGAGWSKFYTVQEATWDFYFLSQDPTDIALGILSSTSQQYETIFMPVVDLTEAKDMYISFAYDLVEVANPNQTVYLIMCEGDPAVAEPTVIAEIQPNTRYDDRFAQVDVAIPEEWCKADVNIGFVYMGQGGSRAFIDNIKIGTLMEEQEIEITYPVHAMDIIDMEWTVFDAEKTEEVKTLAEAGSLLTAADYAYGTIYGVEYQSNEIIKIDPETYEETRVGVAFPNTVTDMAFSYKTNKMYFLVSRTEGEYMYTDLYEMDIADTDCTVNYVAPIILNYNGEEIGAYGYGIACEPNGHIVVLMPSGYFLVGSPETGVCELMFGVVDGDGNPVHQAGIQSITYDWNNDLYYWAYYDIESEVAEFYHLVIEVPEEIEDASKLGKGLRYIGVTHNACEYTAIFTVNENEPEPPTPIEKFTVEFFDWNGRLLSKQRVVKGEDAVAPEDPTRTGYVFVGWDKDFTNVQEDIEVTAVYEKEAPKMFNVTFVDGLTGDILAMQQVEEGESATAPETPIHEGYKFIGWDKDFRKITEDIVVTALYEKVKELKGDVDQNGVIEAADATEILRVVAQLETLKVSETVADANNDGIVDSGDATKILRVVAQLEEM